MTALAMALVLRLAVTPFVDLPTEFWGIAPEVKADSFPGIKRKKDKAVVLVHGLLPRPIHPLKAEKPEAHSWQLSTGSLVKAVSEDFDVFGFSYAQTVTADSVVLSKGLRDGIQSLKDAGYKEIALVGHSAGALIVRRFVEVFPDSGVTKIVTIGSPFLGSNWAKVPTFVLPKNQLPFIRSLQPEFREGLTKDRSGPIPESLEFGTVICKLPRLDNDTIVGIRSQWPEDLQKQGISAVLAEVNHFEAMTNESCTNEVAKLLKNKIRRWSPEEVAKAQKVLFGEEKKK